MPWGDLPMTTPQGLGLWIAFQGPALAKFGGSWGALAARCRDLGVHWIAPRAGQGGSREGDWSPAAARAAIEACHALGVAVYPWWYSLPGKSAAEVDLAESLLADGADGIIIDAEAEWAGHATAARAFGAALRARVGDAPYVGHAPLAWLAYHGDWPYQAFGEFCDGVHPQMYWTELAHGSYAEMMAKCAPDWDKLIAAGDVRAKGFAPIGCTYGHELNVPQKPPGAFKPEDLQAFLDRYGDLPALSLYTIEAASPEAWAVLSARLQTIRDADTLRNLAGLAEQTGENAIVNDVVDPPPSGAPDDAA